MQPAPNAGLNWDDARLFLSLSRARTVGAAAKALAVDASTVSRRLAALEEILGTTLFARGRDGISATKAAEDLLPVAEQVEEAMNRFAGVAGSFEREVSGLVRLACPPDVAAVVVAPMLGALFARYPSLRVALEPGEASVDLTRREADIALRTVRPTRGDLVMTRVATARWLVVAAPELSRALGTLRAWTDAPWIGWSESFSHIPPARWLERNARVAEPRVRSGSLAAQLAAAAAGVGVVLVPEGSAEHYGLVPVRLAPALRAAAHGWPTDDLYLVTHRALRDVPRVKAVWDALVERLGEPSRVGRRHGRR